MTSAARNGRLTDELITSLTGLSEKRDKHKFSAVKDRATRSLRHHGFGRTDQFDVQAQLEGLDEKLRVKDEDALANALTSRLATLQKTAGRYTPDVLAFLLQLSDQPVRHSKIEDLELLKPTDAVPALTWAEIIEEDPLDETGVWEGIDYAADSSEDEDAEIRIGSQDTLDDAQSPAWTEPGPAKHIEAHVVPVDVQELDDLRRGQFWISSRPSSGNDIPYQRAHAGLSYITELQCIREVLFMLSGLPTCLFRKSSHQEMVANEAFALGHVEQSTFRQILRSFATIGQELDVLRRWTKMQQRNPVMQTFRAAIEDRLRAFESSLAQYQGEINGSRGGALISLLDAESRVKSSSSSLVRLSDVLTGAGLLAGNDNEGFKCLELLYEQICAAQMVGDDNLFHSMARMFFECFQTYLQPLEKWMLDGELQSEDGDLPIVKNEGAGHNVETLWHDHYSLRRTQAGHVHAPSFLHVASIKIFNAGKSIIFLKSLGEYHASPDNHSSPRPGVDYQTVIGSNRHAVMASFTEEFDQAFGRWIVARQQSASLTLRQHLFSNCGLWKCLDALEYIYFLKDGASFNHVATNMFDKIDGGREGWNDRFVLTELVQGAYSHIHCVEEDAINVRCSPGRYGSVQSRRRSVKILANMALEYTMPWQVMNIIRPSSLVSYQRVFTFLLQIRRVQYILGRRRLLRENADTLGDEDADLFFSIRHRLLWHANLLYHYLANLVILPCTNGMRERLAAAEDVDAMISVHEVYISTLEDHALLSKKLAPIHQAIISILDLAILLSDAHAAYAGEMNFDVTDRSLSFHGTQTMPSARGARRRRDVSSDEDDNSDDEVNEADTSYISFQETMYRERLTKIRGQFDRLCAFVRAGLRGVARAGGESCWEMLAESLEAGIAQQANYWQRQRNKQHKGS